jgi:hypothetical protein
MDQAMVLETNQGNNMTKAKQDAAYLYEHYIQSGKNKGFVEMLYNRVVKQEGLKLWEAKALANEFNKLVKQG